MLKRTGNVCIALGLLAAVGGSPATADPITLDLPELTGSFIHGQTPISATVDFGIDFEYMPDMILEVTATGMFGMNESGDVFPADLVVTLNHPYIDPHAIIPPTVIGPFGDLSQTYSVDNTPGDVFGDLDAVNDLVGVFPAVFEIVIESNNEHGEVLFLPSEVEILNVSLTLIPFEPHQSCCPGCGDGFVGINDLNIVLSSWNQNVPPGDCCQGDYTDDGFVGIDDLNLVLANWNAGTPPAASIPEPATLLCLGIGLALTLRRC